MHHTDTPNLYATSTLGALSWVLAELYRHGPGWPVVPPLLFGVATLVGAVRGYQNDAHRRRLEREKHEADQRIRRLPGFLTFDQIEGNNGH